MELQFYLKSKKSIVDNALKKYFLKNAEEPAILNTAMKYSIFAGGKRLRPILCIAACGICGGVEKNILPTACGIEMLHTYSLIHDDLPAMDDDDYRRGKLTSHKKFGEAIAILAGDSLLTKAFEIIHPKVVREISIAAGARGMVGGQAVDVQMGDGRVGSPVAKRCRVGSPAAKEMPSRFACGEEDGKKKINYIHEHKTAKMLEVSMKAGAILSNASHKKIKALGDYGIKIGLAFQIADDILDITGNKKKLGKSGSDVKNKKLTYPSIYGIEKSKAKAKGFIESAKNDLKIFGKKAVILEKIADYIIQRDF